jgi:hypothetical protein
MKWGAIVLLCVLGGCATTEEVLSKEPTEVFRTSTPPAEVAFCLANKSNIQVLDRADGSKVGLLKDMYGSVLLAYTIWPEDDGSRVELRREFGPMVNVGRECLQSDTNG